MSSSRTMRPPAPAKNPLLVALADALAGALGSVVAVLAFYPIDIAKTRTQALCGEQGWKLKRAMHGFRGVSVD